MLRVGKANMVEVQNATLAGGIAIGCIADWDILPATAIVIGCGSGILSVCWYKWVIDWVE
jgi:ammonium transporter Rh